MDRVRMKEINKRGDIVVQGWTWREGIGNDHCADHLL